jgi:putative CocE/NonD family hydrolase
LELPEVAAFQTGSNVWEAYDEWPPQEGIESRNLYLHGEGRLSFDAPTVARQDAYDEYVSDPDSPVPFRHRPIRYPTGWGTWQAENQRFVHGRPDVLSWESEPLKHDLSITGDAVAHLFASTTGTGADWIVKLIDVYPDDHPNPDLRGYQSMVAGEVFRARFRNDFRVPEPVVANQVTAYDINLRDRNHRFLAGHRIMVQIQSTWFPIIDRNPQTWVPNIFEAREEDFQKATHRVHRSARYPTHITLPVNIGRPTQLPTSGSR